MLAEIEWKATGPKQPNRLPVGCYLEKQVLMFPFSSHFLYQPREHHISFLEKEGLV